MSDRLSKIQPTLQLAHDKPVPSIAGTLQSMKDYLEDYDNPLPDQTVEFPARFSCFKLHCEETDLCLTCPSCGRARYCSRQHQVEDQDIHSHFCRDQKQDVEKTCVVFSVDKLPCGKPESLRVLGTALGLAMDNGYNLNNMRIRLRGYEQTSTLSLWSLYTHMDSDLISCLIELGLNVASVSRYLVWDKCLDFVDSLLHWTPEHLKLTPPNRIEAVPWLYRNGWNVHEYLDSAFAVFYSDTKEQRKALVMLAKSGYSFQQVRRHHGQSRTLGDILGEASTEAKTILKAHLSKQCPLKRLLGAHLPLLSRQSRLSSE